MPSLWNQRASHALSTNQPSPVGTAPCSVLSRGASGTTVSRLIPMQRSLPVADRPRRPEWMKVRAPSANSALLRGERPHAGAQPAHGLRGSALPEHRRVLGRGTATFMILGDICTRACRYCYVHSGPDGPPDPLEPLRLAQAAAQMKLSHVVVTSVDRDDLRDGGRRRTSPRRSARSSASAGGNGRGPHARFPRRRGGSARDRRSPHRRTCSTTTSRRCRGSTPACAAPRRATTRRSAARARRAPTIRCPRSPGSSSASARPTTRSSRRCATCARTTSTS